MHDHVVHHTRAVKAPWQFSKARPAAPGPKRGDMVKTPSGAFQDIFDAWAGHFPYDPCLIEAPTVLIRGAWDGMCADADAAWLLNAIPKVRDVKLSRGTHLMHLEENRYVLYRETEAFLTAARN